MRRYASTSGETSSQESTYSTFSSISPVQQRAIVVLKRDLSREENRRKAAAAEAAAKAAAEAAPPSVHSPPSISPTVPEPPPTSPALPEAQQQKVSTLPMRRQSTISLSSLHRPPFPHKLDLSTASLRLNPDDPMLQSGLASPVALAPKSSIPKAAPDFPFGSVTDVDIDLTVGEDPAGVGMHGPHNGDPSIGSSADKPIELDLDLDMNIFDAHPHPDDNIQSGPLSLGEPSAAVQVKQEDHQIDLDFLKSLQPDDPSAMKDDILASLDPGGLSQQASGPGDPAHDLLTSLQASNTAQADTTHLSDSLAPSSSAMLMAGLEAVADIQSQDDNAPHSMSSGTQGYEFDLGMLEQPMDMQDLFNIDATDVEGSDSRPL